jgi:hypothetical protein
MGLGDEECTAQAAAKVGLVVIYAHKTLFRSVNIFWKLADLELRNRVAASKRPTASPPR